MKTQSISKLNKPIEGTLTTWFFKVTLKRFFLNMKKFGEVHFNSKRFFISGTKPSKFLLNNIPVRYRQFVDDVSMITKNLMFKIRTQHEVLRIVEGKFFGLGKFRMLIPEKDFKTKQFGKKPFYYLILVPSISFILRLWFYNTKQWLIAQFHAVTIIVLVYLCYFNARCAYADSNIRETEKQMRAIEEAMLPLLLEEYTVWAYKYLEYKIKPLDF